MHTRHEKENIKRNRMEMEKQFTERRLQDFQQALDREAVSLFVDIVFWGEFISDITYCHSFALSNSQYTSILTINFKN